MRADDVVNLTLLLGRLDRLERAVRAISDGLENANVVTAARAARRALDEPSEPTPDDAGLPELPPLPPFNWSKMAVADYAREYGAKCARAAAARATADEVRRRHEIGRQLADANERIAELERAVENATDEMNAGEARARVDVLDRAIHSYDDAERYVGEDGDYYMVACEWLDAEIAEARKGVGDAD